MVQSNVWRKRGTIGHLVPSTKPFVLLAIMTIKVGWQRRWDSNPRDPSGPTPLAGERLRPLGHVSVDPFSGELDRGQAGFRQVSQHF